MYKNVKNIFIGLLFLLQTSGFSYNKNNTNTNTYQTKIVNTPIFYSLPKISSFHHIILATKNKDIKQNFSKYFISIVNKT